MLFCKKDKNVDYRYYQSINNVEEQLWNEVVNDKNVYLSIPYLKAIESESETSVASRYVLVLKDGKPVLAAMVQLVDLEDYKELHQESICILRNKIQETLLATLGFKIMVCGNVFATGENGFLHKDVSTDEALKLLSTGLQQLRKEEKASGETSFILLKEFWPESFKNSDHLKDMDYRDFMVDVNMVLKINPSWNTLDDYLASMVSKFRTKAKGVFKKSTELESRLMSAQEMDGYKKEIQHLYESVHEKADFKVGKLTTQNFIKLRELLKDKFLFTGYFLNDKMVGFNTLFLDNHVADANYIGVDYALNKEYAIYQRMLYDLVDNAITNNCTELRLGRTAEEIKSTIGAEPRDMKLYMRHKNVVSNQLIKPIINSITPREFEIRNPFKQALA